MTADFTDNTDYRNSADGEIRVIRAIRGQKSIRRISVYPLFERSADHLSPGPGRWRDDRLLLLCGADAELTADLFAQLALDGIDA